MFKRKRISLSEIDKATLALLENITASIRESPQHWEYTESTLSTDHEFYCARAGITVWGKTGIYIQIKRKFLSVDLPKLAKHPIVIAYRDCTRDRQRQVTLATVAAGEQALETLGTAS